MKKYESAEINIFIFGETDTVVASSAEPFVPYYERGSNDTEIL